MPNQSYAYIEERRRVGGGGERKGSSMRKGPKSYKGGIYALIETDKISSLSLCRVFIALIKFVHSLQQFSRTKYVERTWESLEIIKFIAIATGGLKSEEKSIEMWKCSVTAKIRTTSFGYYIKNATRFLDDGLWWRASQQANIDIGSAWLGSYKNNHRLLHRKKHWKFFVLKTDFRNSLA